MEIQVNNSSKYHCNLEEFLSNYKLQETLGKVEIKALMELDDILFTIKATNGVIDNVIINTPTGSLTIVNGKPVYNIL